MKKIIGTLTIIFTLVPIPLALMVSTVDAFSFWWWVVCGSEMIAMILLGILCAGLTGSTESTSHYGNDSNNLAQIKKYQELDFMRYKGDKK